MARKKSFLGVIFAGRKKISMTSRFGDAMKILSSAKPTKLRNSKARAGIFK